MTLVDTNVIFDILTDDRTWADWSSRQLQIAALAGPLIVNDVIYAEVSVRYASIEALEDVLLALKLRLVPIPRPALFLAAKAFGRYRSRGGAKSGVRSDLFIGAHATVSDIPLLTRDVGRFRDYFPAIRLIAPA